MKILFDTNGSVRSLERLMAQLDADPAVRGLMVLACDANGWTPADIDPLLTSLSTPVFGGIFPKIIYEADAYNQGVLVVGLTVCPDIQLIPQLSDPSTDYDAILEAPAEAWAQDLAARSTIMVFVDGLSRRIADLIDALFYAFGLQHHFIGGGAGSLSFKQQPCVITPQGVLADCGILVRLTMRSGIGVAHGWQPISEGMKVTEADRNTIISLDWQPAFEHYRKLVEAHSGWTFTADNFFDIAKCYPFGINKLDGEVVVRDPITTDGQQGLVCVGEVPVGSFVFLLNGTSNTLITAAAHARYLAWQSAPTEIGHASVTFFIDCISRALFLEGQLGAELATVAATDGRLLGAMTLGEIASSGRDYPEFYNKTAVVALFAE